MTPVKPSGPTATQEPVPAASGAPYVRGAGLGLPALTGHEWLLTNGLGGYAMGTASGIPTRRYHGLLIASLAPPVDRVLGLHSIAETLSFLSAGGTEFAVDLSSYRFASGVIHPRGHEHLARFEKDEECSWVWSVGGRDGVTDVRKTLAMVAGANTVRVTYSVRPSATVRLSLRPFVALRDHHHLVRARGAQGSFSVSVAGSNVRTTREGRDLALSADAGVFSSAPTWWFDFAYETERDRGFDCVEDLYSPGLFEIECGPGRATRIVLEARMAGGEQGAPRRSRIAALMSAALGGAAPPAGERRRVERLVAAADQFVVRRGNGDGVSVVAGYPWFTDWGRDTLISLPGLLLCTGRFDEARRVLETFARHEQRGLVPNVFSDRTGEAEYNTVDAPLWFIHAACEYGRVSGDRAALAPGSVIGGACLRIAAAYRAGTDHGIGMDRDSLIRAGDETTQLTWMDARRDGIVFTPRHGKPVEINALWHNGLLALAGAIERDDGPRAADLRELAARVASSFRAAFWDADRSLLYDVIDGGGGAAASRQIRPNQIFAVSLPSSPLSAAQQAGVVRAVRERLLTPHGLRTLDPADPAYCARYEGVMACRDRAYHNGTAWPWLLGPFAEAVMRSEGFSSPSRAEARRLLTPLLVRLDGESIGQLPEVFDGDDAADRPQRPGGCIAQAWSVAETLRVWKLAAAAGGG